MSDDESGAKVIAFPEGAKCPPGSMALWAGRWCKVEAASGLLRVVSYETAEPLLGDALYADLPADVAPHEIIGGETIFEERVEVDVRELRDARDLFDAADRGNKILCLTVAAPAPDGERAGQ